MTWVSVGDDPLPPNVVRNAFGIPVAVAAPVEPDLDTVDLVSVCDIDADAIIAWRRTVHVPSIVETFSSLARTWRRILANWHPPR
ncbi:hypothetical protein BOWSER_43 [Gordonia phage Bowser]|uniref:Uncharacterized protein n=1 Tax=Gordonia phage Bowser TaxID=1838063 RepID=A0A160DCP1_9CAUD|nr:hypothetical protein BH770_gp43 [Gordonia phage Bowser]ANA85438.1 hypothetical protein BOWSER_43 [Gordonia phage Bowser]